MRGRDAGARCGGARNGPPGLQKRAVQESLRTAEKSRAGKPPDRKKGCAGKPPDRRRGRLTEAPAADRRGTRKDTPTAGSGRRPPRHSQRCPTAGCGGTEKGPKRSAIRFSNPEIPHHRKTGAIRRSGLPGYFRSAFGCNSAPRTAAYKCDATPFHPTRRTLHTPLLFSTSVHPFQRRAVRPRRIASDRSHRPHRRTSTPPPSGLPAPDACRPPVTPQRLRLFSPCRSPRPFARHLRSLDAASSSPPQGKHPDFRSEARFFAH